MFEVLGQRRRMHEVDDDIEGEDEEHEEIEDVDGARPERGPCERKSIPGLEDYQDEGGQAESGDHPAELLDPARELPSGADDSDTS